MGYTCKFDANSDICNNQLTSDTFLVNSLYAYRIWIVSKGRSRVIPGTVATIVVLGSGVAIGKRLMVL
ncbi:hypothetical protein AZE42_04641 [Rhizopogon vesiculosus]|uniref:Uncharacterized protein n=1 Tax=Rhizopogon vesiculosus TaxID=180088 RepID=A0A1J8PN77_9AGAM|nr:hypothetical protein AZE42_04641 [Rhizopogon vesiculosus]